MTPASVMTAQLNAAMAALTPLERWDAMRRLDGDFVTDRWFILAGVSAIVVLTAILIVVSYRRAKQHKVSSRLFSEYADRLGLSGRQCQILRNIAARTRLRHSESIFTTAAAFDRGAAEIVRETLAILGAQKSSRLSAELSVLREKLGFEMPRAISTGSAIRPSSRQIPVGKKLYLSGSDIAGPAHIESTVIKSDDIELAVRLAGSLETNPGELCCVRYNFGASVWEFDAPVVSCHGGILVLSHTDDVRFINRRRFLRVPVNQPAFIARFPFARTFPPGDDGISQQSQTHVSADTWGPPEFVQAEVTELAGPGLRVEAPLEVKVGERVVVILKIGGQAGTWRGRPALASQAEPAPSLSRGGPRRTARIVEDIGEVRHTEATQNGFSIAVELIGLNDSNVNELIRATNAACVKAAVGGSLKAEGFGDGSAEITPKLRLRVPPAAVVQGV
jgi:hypothetical protein